MSSPISVDALRVARWFAGKHRRVASVRPVGWWADGALGVVDVAYDDDGAGERYLVLADALGWRALLDDLLEAPVAGPAGRIELRSAPELSSLLAGDRQRIP